MAALTNPKWEAFALHYAKTGNATESYRVAGYSARTENALNSSATRLLKSAKIQERLAELAAEMNSDKIAGIREIQEILTAIARGETTDDAVTVEAQGEGISKTKVTPIRTSNRDRIKAAETLGKMQGAFDTRLQVEMMIPIFGGEDGLSDE